MRFWLSCLTPLLFVIGSDGVAAHSPESCSGSTAVLADGNTPVVAGYVEWAKLRGANLSLKAKLDTGAKSSSLNAADAEMFKRDNRRWIRFSARNFNGETVMIERPIERFARIRRAGAKISERPVIKLEICVAGQSSQVDVTLADRKGMNYSLLIGRSFLRSRILVDSSATFLSACKCQ